MVDCYWYGETSRVSQEAPVPVVAVASSEERPGGAANVALNIVSLGAQCTLIGAVGDDAEAARLIKTLEAAGVVCDLVTVPRWQTTKKLRIVSKRQQLLRTDFETDLPADAAAAVRERFSEHVASADAVIIEDYDKGAIADPSAFIDGANVPVVVDPKYKPFESYAGAAILKPNMPEFVNAAGPWRDDADLAARAKAVLSRANLGSIVITRGGEGMTVVESGDEADQGEYLYIPAAPVEVYDQTGAGDTGAALLGLGAALGWSVADSARLANHGAGIVCTKMGTAAVSAPELEAALARSERADLGFLTREQLMHAVARERTHNRRIVLTNGCFDILHAGHVAYLEEARELGDRLVVAVNDDASTRRLKGEGRPVNTLERRMRVLEGLTAVDWVVSFSEDTPETLLELVRPDILVKGGDYSVSEVVGASFVTSYGGDVQVLTLVEDCSTSEIVDRIRGN